MIWRHPLQERLLVQQLGAPGFYHVVARYGYAQRIQQGPDLVQVQIKIAALHEIDIMRYGYTQSIQQGPNFVQVAPSLLFVRFLFHNIHLWHRMTQLFSLLLSAAVCDAPGLFCVVRQQGPSTTYCFALLLSSPAYCTRQEAHDEQCRT